MEKELQQFIKAHCSLQSPLLLALSGGPDSMALFHLLKRMHYPFEVAHVNHNWRMSSSREASYLRQLCEQENIPFHLKELPPPSTQANLEEQGRNKRLNFFRTLVQSRMLQGVVLAHHADDQAETVLKRLFEGASLSKLHALLPVTRIDSLTLFRPLLTIRKTALLNWLEKHQVPYFIDATNEDPRFLRGRLRSQILPGLSKTFGKEITPALCKVGEAAREFEVFLEEMLSPIRLLTQGSEEGPFLDFQLIAPRSAFFWKSVIKDFAQRHEIPLSQALVDAIYSHLEKGSHCKFFVAGKRRLKVHKRRLIAL